MLPLIPLPYRLVSSDTKLKKVLSEMEFLREENNTKMDLHSRDCCVVEMR